jgi:hypothetical protein
MVIMGILPEQGKTPFFLLTCNLFFPIRNPQFFLLHYSKPHSYELFGQDRFGQLATFLWTICVVMKSPKLANVLNK